MSHRKWRETKQQPSRDSSGHQISCCLVSLHFLCDILATFTVQNSFQNGFFILQLDPTKEEVFEILGKIYAEFYGMFGFDSFHMGGKDVKSACWRTSPDILAYMDSDPELSSKDDDGMSQC